MARAVLRGLQAGPLLILALLVLVMTLSSPYFLTRANLTNVGFQTSIVAVLALGQLVVILTRGVDLSVGAVVALSGVLGAIAAGAGAGGATVLAVMLATGAAVGLLNAGILVGGRVMNPFIVTLGTLSIVRGLALVISDAKTQTGLPDAISATGTSLVGPVPLPVVLVGVLAVA